MACNEIMDILNLTEELVKDTKAALVDGKITVSDLPKYLPALLLTKDAVVGAKNIPAELSTITNEDITAIFSKCVEIIGVILVAIAEEKK